MILTPAEKCKKLLEYSVILKTKDKKSWLDLLPKMQEKQIQTLYNVLVDEVRAWKKEGISIIPDLSLENKLMPEVQHGASVNSLKQMLTGEESGSATTDFKEKLDQQVHMPELAPPPPVPVPPHLASHPKLPVAPPNSHNAAWMLSSKVMAPKAHSAFKPQPSAVPKVRNRVARHGLESLKNIKNTDDLAKIEPAHLRQGPLTDQIAAIKQTISKLAVANDTLPVNILPIFEQSPLFKTYLKAGGMLLDRNNQDQKVTLDEIMNEVESSGLDSLTQTEFEAIADLKKELEVLAGL